MPIASGSDGGGSIRIPAGFTGLFGLKSTFGRIPRGPDALQPPLTVVVGCVSRSVRDTARWFDVCNGFDPRDTLSLPRVEGWEARPRLLRPGRQAGGGRRRPGHRPSSSPGWPPWSSRRPRQLIADAGLRRVDVVVELPQGGLEWAMSNLVGLAGALGDRYPACNDDLTPEIQLGMNLATYHLNVQTAGATEMFRIDVNERMADLFEQTDFVFVRHQPRHGLSAPPAPCPPPSATSTCIAEYGFDRPSATTAR